MKARKWNSSRFDSEEAEPLGSLSNLVDIMLVFACGLIAALIASKNLFQEELSGDVKSIERIKELPSIPKGVGDVGSGYHQVGEVYRDPETGKLILISD